MKEIEEPFEKNQVRDCFRCSCLVATLLLLC